MCLRFEGFPTEKNETSDNVLEKIMGICKDSGLEIPERVTDWLHRTGVPYVDKTNKSCKSVIVRFFTFRYRTIVCRGKKNMKCPVRGKIDLTNKWHNLLVFANKYVSNTDSVKFCYADINCRLKIKWEDVSINDTFFCSLVELKCHLNADEWSLEVLCFTLNTMSNPCHYGKKVFV